MSNTNATTPTLSIVGKEDDLKNSHNMDRAENEKDVSRRAADEKIQDSDRLEKGASNGKISTPLADSEEYEIVQWDEGESAKYVPPVFWLILCLWRQKLTHFKRIALELDFFRSAHKIGQHSKNGQ
jgi:hypothetical protein